MNEIKRNKIWGCITTAEAVERLSKNRFFFANSNHILVISDERPEGTVEMTEEYLKCFKTDDWMFINSVLNDVRKDQLERYPEEAEKLAEEETAFLERFRQELGGMRVGTKE